MKENKISIIINKPIADIFEFTTNPINTPRWIDSVVEEKTSEWPVKIGSTYQNCDSSNDWNYYTVSQLAPNKIFELVSRDGNYHVRYTYSVIEDKKTEMEYCEWVDNGEISDPFTPAILNKLKEEIEKD